LFAAAVAAGRGRRVLLLEKNKRPGLKILISGGGRCNLTTTRTGADLEREYGARRGRFLRHALRAFPPAALRELITAAGVPLQEEDLEKVFPCSGKASDVLDALVRMADRAGVELRTGSPMTGVRREDGAFAVTTPHGVVRAGSLVLCTGGKSYPKSGATGDGYAAAAALGHTVTPTHPALAPLRTDAEWTHGLAGIVLPAPVLSLLDKEGVVVNRRRRPVLFTHKGLSGPAPMDLAGDVEELGGACTVVLDLAPDEPAEGLERALTAQAAMAGKRAAAHALPRELPERLRLALAGLAAAEAPLAALPRAARQRLVGLLKRLPVPVAGSLGFDHAEVTRGGVALDEVDPRTMASLRMPGLYVCGELLDVDGPIGGFNFQAAFATARLAGLAV
jgi:predicted Rossmann fold flavoprotein